MRLRTGGVYLIETADDETLVGAYAGEEAGCHVFATGVYAPMWIPTGKVREATRIG